MVKKLKILVTGGAGYIGSHTVQHLLKAGYEVIIYDNLSTGSKESCPKSIKLVIGDVTDLDLLKKVLIEEKIEAVIHFAGKIKVPESFQIPLDYYEANVVGTLRVVQACLAAKVKKLIFSSTAAVYGDANVSPVKEDFPLNPVNPYGRSKRMAEEIIKDSGETNGIKYVILRYFNVSGAAMDGSNGPRAEGMTQLIKVAVETASGKRKYIEIFGTDYPTKDGTCIRDYLHIEDLASAHLAALDYLILDKKSSIMNVGYGNGYSVKEVIDTLKKISNLNFCTKLSPRRAGDPSDVVADNYKILNNTNWRPAYNDLELICKSAFDWEKINK